MTTRVRAWQLVACRPRDRLSRGVLALARTAGFAALLAVTADAPAEENFGRLFFSIEERQMLDDMRDDDIEPETVKPQPGKTTVAPVVDVISFDGKVERSSGSGSTIWVNGRPVLTGNRTVEGIRIQSSRGTNGKTRFILPPSDRGQTEFSLKVGQKIAVQSGKVLDAYEARAAEDAKSVFAKELPADAAANPDGEKSSGEAGDAGAAAPSPGS
jgi:hypothetical protein